MPPSAASARGRDWLPVGLNTNAVEKAGGFAIKSGDAQMGALKTLYDGRRPNGYDPMKKQGAIILGIGGDNSNSAVGTFFEGGMTSGYRSVASDAAVQANIVAAGYGH